MVFWKLSFCSHKNRAISTKLKILEFKAVFISSVKFKGTCSTVICATRYVWETTMKTQHQLCLYWRFISDMVTIVTMSLIKRQYRQSWCCVFIVVSQTYLVAQITVEQVPLNLTDEINTALNSRILSFVEIARFLWEQKDNFQNTIVRKVAGIAKSKLQNKFHLFTWKRQWLNLYLSKIENYPATCNTTRGR